MRSEYKQVGMVLLVFFLVVSFLCLLGWGVHHLSLSREAGTVSYANVGLIYQLYPSLRDDIEEALKDKKLTYYEVYEIYDMQEEVDNEKVIEEIFQSTKP